MNIVDKLIFDELSSRKTVILPSVGMLSILKERAAVKTKTSLSAPANKVIFIDDVPQNATSIIDILNKKAEPGSDPHKIYQAWLANANRGGSIVIEGVGMLRQGVFSIDPQLDAILNPVDNNSISLQKAKRRMPWYMILLFILLGALLGGVGYHFWANCESCNPGNSNTVMTAENPIVTADDIVDDANDIAEEADTNAGSALNTQATQKYHVVAGIFAKEENADKYIVIYKNAYPGVDAKKVPFKEGKFVVSIYATDSEQDAERTAARFRRQHFNSDLWVYQTE